MRARHWQTVLCVGVLLTVNGCVTNATTELIEAPFHHLLIACAASPSVADVISIVAAAFPQAHVPDLLQRGISNGALIIQ